MNNFERGALLAVFNAVKGRWRQAHLPGEGGVSQVAALLLQKPSQLLFQPIGGRGHVFNMPKRLFRMWKMWLDLCVPFTEYRQVAGLIVCFCTTP
jgi:hypothetical protein